MKINQVGWMKHCHSLKCLHVTNHLFDYFGNTSYGWMKKYQATQMKHCACSHVGGFKATINVFFWIFVYNQKNYLV
jgi:hypothetical protein